MEPARHIETPVEGVGLLQDFFISGGGAELPDDVKEKLLNLIKPGNSPVVAAAEAAELIFARREYEVGEGSKKKTKTLPPELLEIGAELAQVCGFYNLHGLGNDNRGASIAATIRSMDAVASDAPPAVIEPPTPKAEYVAPPAEGEAPAIPAPPGGLPLPAPDNA